MIYVQTINVGRHKVKYSDLTARYEEFSNAKNTYWNDLAEQARDLFSAFETSLDLPAQTWEDPEGEVHRYAELGTVENGEFKAGHPFLFKGAANLELPFAIKLTLERGPNIYPKASVSVGIVLRRAGDQLNVVIKGNQDIGRVVPLASIEGRFAEVCQDIKAQIVATFNPRIFG